MEKPVLIVKIWLLSDPRDEIVGKISVFAYVYV